MQGNDNWKWGVVFILLAIFLVTANQAYKHVTSQENFEPPDDYLKGDSWDLERQEAKEASADGTRVETGQPPATDNNQQAPAYSGNDDDDIDWNKL